MTLDLFEVPLDSRYGKLHHHPHGSRRISAVPKKNPLASVASKLW
jgi:hypothetical protein